MKLYENCITEYFSLPYDFTSEHENGATGLVRPHSGTVSFSVSGQKSLSSFYTIQEYNFCAKCQQTNAAFWYILWIQIKEKDGTLQWKNIQQFLNVLIMVNLQLFAVDILIEINNRVVYSLRLKKPKQCMLTMPNLSDCYNIKYMVTFSRLAVIAGRDFYTYIHFINLHKISRTFLCNIFIIELLTFPVIYV